MNTKRSKLKNIKLKQKLNSMIMGFIVQHVYNVLKTTYDKQSIALQKEGIHIQQLGKIMLKRMIDLK